MRPSTALLLLTACHAPGAAAVVDGAAAAEAAAVDIVRRVVDGTPMFDDAGVVVPAGPDSATALNLAMLAANQNGGGTVATVDGATYALNGPLDLLSHVRLRVGRGTTLRFGRPAARPPVLRSVEGMVFYGVSPQIRAYRAHGVRVEGHGATSVIDGGGRDWHEWNRGSRHRLRSLKNLSHAPSERERVDELTPPTLVEFFACTRIHLANLTLRDAAFWTTHCVLSYGVLLEHVVVESSGRNTDGIVVDSSADVVVRHNAITSGDDGISIKSGRDEAGRGLGRPTEDLVLLGNVITRASAAGVAVGSEVSGGVRRVYVLNTTIHKAFVAFYVKATRNRGAYVRDVYVRDLAAEQVKQCINVNSNFKNSTPHPPSRPTDFRRLSFSSITCRGLLDDARVLDLTGQPRYPIRGVWIDGLTVPDAVRAPFGIAFATGVSVAGRIGAAVYDLRNVSAAARRTWTAATSGSS